MKVRLTVQHSKANVKTVVLHSDAVLGRSTECNLRLASGQISRKHCKLLISEERVAILDLGSANGTFLNGELLDANVETIIPAGSELDVGPVTFTVEYDDPTADTQIRKSPPPAALSTNSPAPLDGPKIEESDSNRVTPPGGTQVVPDENPGKPLNQFDEEDSSITPIMEPPPKIVAKAIPIAKAKPVESSSAASAESAAVVEETEQTEVEDEAGFDLQLESEDESDTGEDSAEGTVQMYDGFEMEEELEEFPPVKIKTGDEDEEVQSPNDSEDEDQFMDFLKDLDD